MCEHHEQGSLIIKLPIVGQSSNANLLYLVLRDFPYNSALFGYRQYNDPSKTAILTFDVACYSKMYFPFEKCGFSSQLC